MAGAKLDIQIDMNAVQKALRWFDGKKLKAAQRAGLRESAQRVADIVREEYRNPPGDERTQLTRQIYDQGKSAGNRGPRKPYPGAASLRRSNPSSNLANAVKVLRLDADHYQVAIDPGAQQTTGDPDDIGNLLERVAQQLERPRSAVVQMTARMAAYLALLARGEAGQEPTGAFRGDPNKIVGSILIQPVGRGVWARARARALGVVAPPIVAALNKHFSIK